MYWLSALWRKYRIYEVAVSMAKEYELPVWRGEIGQMAGAAPQ